MQPTIPLKSIIFPARQRKEYNDIDKLCISIQTYGILEPLVLTDDNTLLAGGRRYTAATQLGLTDVPFVRITGLTETQKEEIELEENIQRSDLTWQEKVCAIARIHKLRARDAHLASIKWGYEQTGAMLFRSTSNIWYSIRAAELVEAGDKEVIECHSLKDVIDLLIARKAKDTNEALVALTQRNSLLKKLETKVYDEKGNTIHSPKPFEKDGALILGYDINNAPVPASTPTVSTRLDVSSFVHLCSMDEIAPGIPNGTIPVIYTDPPYAINMDDIQQDNTGMNVDLVKETHDVTSNIDILDKFLYRAWDLLTDTGICVLWYDLDQHYFLSRLAENIGFSVQRWPLVWVKTHVCQNGAATYNFTKATEFAMVLRKPKAVLVHQAPTNWYQICNDKTLMKSVHPFWKPLALHNWVLSCIAQPGSMVLDPFAGEGSIPLACLKGNYKPIAYECIPEVYNLLVERMSNPLAY